MIAADPAKIVAQRQNRSEMRQASRSASCHTSPGRAHLLAEIAGDAWSPHLNTGTTPTSMGHAPLYFHRIARTMVSTYGTTPVSASRRYDLRAGRHRLPHRQAIVDIQCSSPHEYLLYLWMKLGRRYSLHYRLVSAAWACPTTRRRSP